MLNQSGSDLLAYLDHPNGWWRDNAQKDIIAKGDKSIVPALTEIATGKRHSTTETAHLGRIHALWTLEGLDAINKDILAAAFQDQEAQVRKTAVWIAERYFEANENSMIEKAAALVNDPSYDVRVQLLLSLYNSKSPKAKEIISEILAKNADNEMITATKSALDKNENVRTFGSRLGQLDAESRKLVINGAAIFKSLCASCHGADAKGLDIGGAGMAAPPLVKSKRLDFVAKENLIKIVLNGLTGPIDGKNYTSIMPAMDANSDEWIASVVSYIRHDFGGRPPRRPGEIPGMAPPAENDASGFPVRKTTSPVVTPQEVKKIREQNAGRNKAWTIAELENNVE
ncbi:c-type cytochrome [Dyadobacter bucti]|uniref:c-type cytochrome n=1 Tax=Dyadobacter bucti TaxID=2572203 RepID=UPI003F6E9CAB